MANIINSIESSPESSSLHELHGLHGESSLSLIETLLKVNQASDQVFHQSMDIYISLIKAPGAGGLLLRSAEELKNAIQNFDDAITEEIKNLKVKV